MHFLSVLLFTLSANVDNFTVGIAYGVKKVKIGILSNSIIALITSLGTFLSMSIGLIIAKLLPIKASNLIGALILIVIGIWFVKDFLLKKQDEVNKDIFTDPSITDIDQSGEVDIKEALTLAIALTINNIGLGIGASITGLNIILTSVMNFIISILSILFGFLLGKSYLSKIFGRFAPLISGIIIIILGIYEIFV